MTTERKKVRPKNRDAEVMKFTGGKENATDIMTWMGENGSGAEWYDEGTPQQYLVMHRGPNLLQVYLGQYVIKDYTGFFRIPEYDLEQMYDFIEENNE